MCVFHIVTAVSLYVELYLAKKSMYYCIRQIRAVSQARQSPCWLKELDSGVTSGHVLDLDFIQRAIEIITGAQE